MPPTKTEERVDESLRELIKAARAVVQDPGERDAALFSAATSFSDACSALRLHLEQQIGVPSEPMVASHQPELISMVLADLARKHCP